MRETTDTNNSFSNGKVIDDGTYDFTIVSINKKFGGENKDKPFYILKLNYSGDQEAEQVLLPNMMGGLLKVLSCTETAPGIFDWDRDAQEGKSFTATVSHGPDKKDPSKIRQHMGQFKAVEGSIPF